jgi:hypothetical protein
VCGRLHLPSAICTPTMSSSFDDQIWYQKKCIAADRTALLPTTNDRLTKTQLHYHRIGSYAAFFSFFSSSICVDMNSARLTNTALS